MSGSVSLLMIGAWSSAYYCINLLTVVMSKKLSSNVDLDTPQPEHNNITLREFLASRTASFVHAVVSFGWSLMVRCVIFVDLSTQCMVSLNRMKVGLCAYAQQHILIDK